MEQLIHELTLPANQGTPDRIYDIQKQIQHLQRQPSAWQLGLDFLQHSESIIRFYGALTLTVKINADWDSDNIGGNEAMKAQLLEALVTSYIRLNLAGDATFVLQKLCSTVTTLYQRLQSSWHSPIRHVFACLLGQQYIQHETIPEVSDIIHASPQASIRGLSGAVRFALTVAEDLGTKTSITSEHTIVQISESCSDVFQILSHCLVDVCHRTAGPGGVLANGTTTGGSENDTAQLAQLCLQAIPLWVGQLKIQASHASRADIQAANVGAVRCIAATLESVEVDALTGAGLQCLIAVQQSSPKLLVKADTEFPRSIARSVSVQKLVRQLQDGEFSAEGVLLVDLLEAMMGQVDLATPQYILEARYAEILQILLGLLRCDGLAMIEDTICQVVLETVISIIEGYTDWDNNDSALDYLRDFVREACESCVTKVKLPADEMSNATQMWDADDRAKFHDFRLDVQDFLQSAFTILGSSLIEAIVQTVTISTSEARWPDFEASIFCLMAFADTMSAEPALYDHLIEATVNSDYFRIVLQSPEVPDKARNTSIRFLTEMTTYLQRYPDLMQILNFLFTSVHQPSLVSSASRAIYTLCDAQRLSLTQALPDFLRSLNGISDLHGIERHRIFGAVAAVVQALSDEEAKVQPISAILEFVSRDMAGIDKEDSSESYFGQLTDLLQTLAAVGRGLRTPNDAPIDLESSVSPNAGFWINGPGSQVQQKVLTLYNQLINAGRVSGGSSFVEAACDFLRSGFTEEHPSPFKFSSATSVELVSGNVEVTSPNIDSVMGSASSLLASEHRDDFQPYLHRLLNQVADCVQRLLAEHHRSQTLGDSNFPSASLDFVSRLLPKWAVLILSSEEGREFLNLFVELSLLVISDPDTLPRRSAASYFSALIDISKPGKCLQEISKSNLETVIQAHSPRILAVLLRLVGGECARSELDVLTDPLRRYVLDQPMLFKSICRQAMKEESAVLTSKALGATTIEQRLRFVAQMDALRGARKSNDVVKDFWIACRGSSFEYIA